MALWFGGQASIACSASPAEVGRDEGTNVDAGGPSSCPSPVGTYSLLMTFDPQGAANCTGSDATITMRVTASGAVTIGGAPKATFPRTTDDVHPYSA